MACSSRKITVAPCHPGLDPSSYRSAASRQDEEGRGEEVLGSKLKWVWSSWQQKSVNRRTLRWDVPGPQSQSSVGKFVQTVGSYAEVFTRS